MHSAFPLPLSKEDEKKYVQQMEAGSKEAKDTLIEHNLRLVAHIARKYTNLNVPQEDLISIGTIGLIKGINTYTSEKSPRLATYAAKCIENEILMSIRTSKKSKQEVSISLPIGVDKDGNEISLNDILGTEPNEVIDSINQKFQIIFLYETIKEVLSPRERQIIILRYGLDGMGSRTQREIASAMNISRSYVSRIEKKALSKLREKLTEEI